MTDNKGNADSKRGYVSMVAFNTDVPGRPLRELTFILFSHGVFMKFKKWVNITGEYLFRPTIISILAVAISGPYKLSLAGPENGSISRSPDTLNSAVQFPATE